jgi:cell division protease FtsH
MVLFQNVDGFFNNIPKLSKLKPIRVASIEYDVVKQFETDTKILFRQNLPKENVGELLQKIDDEKIIEIVFSPELNNVISLDTEYNVYKTEIHPILSTDLVHEAKEHHTDIRFMPFENKFNWLNTLFYIPFIYFGFNLIRNIFRGPMPLGGMNGGMNTLENFGQPTQITKKSNVTLADWAGSPEIFLECTEIVSYLKNNTNYNRIGAKIPKGILLEGPPGTGKTLLAKAIANEAKAHFMAVSGSEFVELFVGMGASRVRKLFQDARKHSPSIIFIDEIDAIGKQRNAASGFGGNDERDQTLNQLLAEMDGFYENNIIVIAATNRKDILDNALLRPGRFDRIIQVPLPDFQSRKAILNVHKKKFSIDSSIDLDPIVSLTSGFSGAQLKNLLNEAAILVAREGGDKILQRHLFEALEKLIVGIIKKFDNRDNNTLERVAIHELGHTIAVLNFPEIFDFDKVTIQQTYNGAGGYTIFREKENLIENGMYTKNILMKRLMVTLGGKAAENIFYGRNEVSLGAMQDLKQANQLAKQMITDFGMGNKLEVFSSVSSPSMVSPHSEYIFSTLEKESLQLVNQAYQDVIQLLSHNKELFEKLKSQLLLNKFLDKNDITQLK